MINGFMSVSRLESSRIIIEPTTFRIFDLIAEVREDFVNTINSHPVTFNNTDDGTEITADRNRIEQVIKNLIGNAVKYSPRGTPITCTYQASESEITFSIKDHGEGIAPEEQKKIFERYYRVENMISKTTAGFGIGLYFCAEIIKLHNGRIWVESEIGKGADFHFSLPSDIS